MAKTLPIQLVKTREKQDEFLKEAGGSNDLPRWATEQIISENSVRLVNALDNLSRLFEGRTMRNTRLPLLLKAKLNEHATAKSYRPNVRSILNQKHKHNVIGISGFREILFKLDEVSDVQAIKNVVVSVQNHTSSKDKPIGVAAIEDISVYKCNFDIEALSNKLLKVQLVDYKDANLNALSEQLLLELGEELGCNIEKVNYAEDLIMFKVSHPSADSIRQIATLDSVISIKEMPYYELVAAPNPYQAEVELAMPIEGEEYPILGILDSGVENSDYLSSWCHGEENNVAGLDEFDINRIHGTMVTSIAVYGDVLENKNYTGCGPLKFVSCIVNSDREGLHILEDELIDYIRTSVQQNPNIKIWNLSQGSQTEVSDFIFSDFAIALDDIQKKNDVLICKSAGNSANLGRITLGAESMLALTVGSICNCGSHPEDLEEGVLSPFSRIGYGPEGLIKPEVVHYGGNKHTGVKVLTGADIQYTAFGTSFSTPRISSLATHLFHRLDRAFDPTLIKALIIHNANYPSVVDKNIVGCDKMYGFGLPVSIDDMLNNDEDEFTMVWQPDFNNGTDYQVIDFPYPSTLIDENGHFYGIVTVTIVTDPILKGGEGNEYCQTDIDVKIGPIRGVNHFVLGAVGTPKTYRNEERIDSLFNILTEDKYSKRQPEIMRERNLIMKNHKWQPVKKFQVDLSTMTTGKKNQIKDCQTWAMTMHAFTRDATMFELQEDGVINTVRTTIIVTIRDPKHNGSVYNEGIRLLNVHNFEHSNIVVNNEIHLLGNIED